MTKAENPPSYPLDHLALRGAADAPALLIGDAPMSFADLDAGVGRLAAWLRAAAISPAPAAAAA
ncbi:MAG TPA: AMP-binding protein, partial [Sphingopyxis terrae]|nr:AMP-binding protein [Sphingopyxis terrae]